MTLDTNILIAYFNGENGVVRTLSRWRQEGRALFISAVSVAEVLAYPSFTQTDREKAWRFLRCFISVPFDDGLADTVAFFRRSYRLSIPDAAIAATAFTRGVPLVTRDHQFQRVHEITLVKI